MPLTITDDELAQTDLTAEQVRVELAVALRDRNELSFFNAAKWAGMDVKSFGDLLTGRGVPWFDAGDDQLDNPREFSSLAAETSATVAPADATTAAATTADRPPAAPVGAAA